uniref:Uncharacterized protein n=1 Tax=Amphimedon queenslandica TaxID=400682 RepID=A0A1X7TS65_AMPQE
MPTTMSGKTTSPIATAEKAKQLERMASQTESIAALLKVVLEDRQRHDEEGRRRQIELAKERERRAKEAAAEQKRQDAEHQLQVEKLKGQMEILHSFTLPATPALEGEPPKGEPKDQWRF